MRPKVGDANAMTIGIGSRAAPAPMAETIAGRAAEQQQRAQRQQIAADHPRQAGAVGRERLRNRRQADVDDRAIDESQAGREHGGGKHAARVRRCSRRSCGRGSGKRLPTVV